MLTLLPAGLCGNMTMLMACPREHCHNRLAAQSMLCNTGQSQLWLRSTMVDQEYAHLCREGHTHDKAAVLTRGL